jgi:hypothetical protein
VRTVPLGESPRRICHMENTAAGSEFAVLTSSISVRARGALSFTDSAQGSSGLADEEEEVSHLRLFDDETFELLDSFAFDSSESAMCIALFTSSLMSGGVGNYLVVGSVIAEPYEEQAKEGRLRLFKVERDFERRRLALETTLDVGGCVYSVLGLKGRIFAGINNKVTSVICSRLYH